MWSDHEKDKKPEYQLTQQTIQNLVPDGRWLRKVWKGNLFLYEDITTVPILASNPNFIKINCIQPQSQSNMAATWKISNVQPLCAALSRSDYKSHCVSVPPDRTWVIFEVNRKKGKQTIGICKFLLNSLSLNIRTGVDPLANKVILHYKNGRKFQITTSFI